MNKKEIFSLYRMCLTPVYGVAFAIYGDAKQTENEVIKAFEAVSVDESVVDLLLEKDMDREGMRNLRDYLVEFLIKKIIENFSELSHIRKDQSGYFSLLPIQRFMLYVHKNLKLKKQDVVELLATTNRYDRHQLLSMFNSALLELNNGKE